MYDSRANAVYGKGASAATPIAAMIAKFNRLCSEVHLPSAERELYAARIVRGLERGVTEQQRQQQQRLESMGLSSGDGREREQKAIAAPPMPHPPPPLTTSDGRVASAGGIRPHYAAFAAAPTPSPPSPRASALPPRPPQSPATVHQPATPAAAFSPSSTALIAASPSAAQANANGTDAGNSAYVSGGDGRQKGVAALAALLAALEAHRDETVALLSLCAKREAIVEETILPSIAAFKRGEMNTLALQTRLLSALSAHQRAALAVVEGVFRWREALSRPFPFMYKGRNCLVAILADCARIEAEGVGSALPLLLRQHPLCSNMIESLALLGGEVDAEGEGSSACKGRALPSAPPLSFALSPRQQAKPQQRSGSGRIGPSAGKSASSSASFLPSISASSPRRGGSASSPSFSASSSRRREFSTSDFAGSSSINISEEASSSTARRGAAGGGPSSSLLPTFAERLGAAEEVLRAEISLQLDLAAEAGLMADNAVFLPILGLTVGGGDNAAAARKKKIKKKRGSGSDSDASGQTQPPLPFPLCGRGGVSVEALGGRTSVWLEALRVTAAESARRAEADAEADAVAEGSGDVYGGQQRHSVSLARQQKGTARATSYSGTHRGSAFLEGLSASAGGQGGQGVVREADTSVASCDSVGSGSSRVERRMMAMRGVHVAGGSDHMEEL